MSNDYSRYHPAAAIPAPLIRLAPSPAVDDSCGPATMLFIDLGARDGRPRRWVTDPTPRLAVDGEGIPVGDGIAIAAYASDAARRATFYETRSGGTSSLYLPDHERLRQFPATADRYDVIKEHSVTTTALDDIVAPHASPPYAIKLDVHGSELASLQGGPRTLQDTVLVDIEYWFLPMYHGTPTAGLVHEFLAGAGFVLVDLTRYWWVRRDGVKVLVFGEAQYIHQDRPLPDVWAQRVPAAGQTATGSRFVSRVCRWVDSRFGSDFAYLRDRER